MAVVTPVVDKLVEVANNIAGGLDAHGATQMRLAGCVGGCALRSAAIGAYAHASRWAAYDVNRQGFAIISNALDCPENAVCSDALSAAQGLLEVGVRVWHGGQAFTPEAAAHYDSTPWTQASHRHLG